MQELGENACVSLVSAFPELYPPVVFEDRFAPLHGGAVVPIGRRRYRVSYERDAVGPLGHDEQPAIVFEETLDALTPFRVLNVSRDATSVVSSVNWRSGTVWFGQPEFKQQGVFPAHDNKVASALFRLHNTHGDCGIDQVFVSLDEDDVRPVAVWHHSDSA